MALQTVTIQVRNVVGAVPLEGASVGLYDSLGIRRGGGITGSNGNAVFPNYPAGAGSVFVHVVGFGPTIPAQAFTVADTGVAQAFTVNLTSLGLTSPTALALCTIYGFVAEPPGGQTEVQWAETPMTGGRTTATGSGVDPTKVLSGRRAGPPNVVYVNQALGRWEIQATVGNLLSVRIPSLGYEKVVVVPSAATAAITDLPEFPQPRQDGYVGDARLTDAFRSR